jgi:cell division initiation protein
MDVSPKTVREVEFREKLRGYHPEDVDQFLERVAKGIEILQERLRAATERSARAERAAAESAGSDDTLRRTLVLAQRTADAAVQEAREQAAQLIADGEAKARELVADAEATAARLTEEAEGSIRAEVAKLAGTRDALQADVAGLTRWIDEHRSFLTSTLSSAVERLQNDLQLQHEPPAVTPVEMPAPQPVKPAAGATAASAESPTSGTETSGSTERAPSAAVNGTGAIGAEDSSTDASAPAEGEGQELRTEPGRRSGKKQEEAAAAQFFAELRDAVDDPQPLGPREAEPTNRSDGAPRDFGFFDDDDDDLAGSRRFGSRLRRRR